MKHLILIASVTLIMASPAQARYPRADFSNNNARFAWADVLQVDPVYETVRIHTPQEVCRDYYSGRGDGSGGALLGVIVGGVLGNTIGKGSGRTAATLAGAATGGVVGGSMARSKDDAGNVQRHCELVDDYQEQRRMRGYDVQYRYRGDVYVARMDYDPGDRIRVRVSVVPVD